MTPTLIMMLNYVVFSNFIGVDVSVSMSCSVSESVLHICPPVSICINLMIITYHFFTWTVFLCLDFVVLNRGPDSNVR
jgi:hypothetical protein